MQLNGAPKYMNALGKRLRARREELGLSIRDLERLTGIDNSLILRMEQGAIANPAPEKLSRVAEALGLDLADVYALAGYSAPRQLPAFTPYLRTKYRDLPQRAVRELERTFTEVAKRHGYRPEGPAPGEDEGPERMGGKR